MAPVLWVALALALIVIGLAVAYIAIMLHTYRTYLYGVTSGKLIDVKKMPNSALLVIDMQNSMLRLDDRQQPVNSVYARAVENINLAADRLADLKSEMIEIAQVKEKGHIQTLFLPLIPYSGTKGAGISPSIRLASPAIFTKLRADAFSNPDLQRYLEEKGVGRLYITGVAAEICVNYTVRGALGRGYEVYVIPEAVVALYGDRSKERRLREYAELGAKLVPIEELGRARQPMVEAIV